MALGRRHQRRTPVTDAARTEETGTPAVADLARGAWGDGSHGARTRRDRRGGHRCGRGGRAAGARHAARSRRRRGRSALPRAGRLTWWGCDAMPRARVPGSISSAAVAATGTSSSTWPRWSRSSRRHAGARSGRSPGRGRASWRRPGSASTGLGPPTCATGPAGRVSSRSGDDGSEPGTAGRVESTACPCAAERLPDPCPLVATCQRGTIPHDPSRCDEPRRSHPGRRDMPSHAGAERCDGPAQCSPWQAGW